MAVRFSAISVFLALGLSVVPTGIADHESNTPARSSAIGGGPVVVEKTGWGQEFQGNVSSLYSSGVVVVNRSTTQDALGVTVSANIYGGSAGLIDGGDYTITVIPAGGRFYVGGASGSIGSVRISRVSATVHVRAMQSKRYLLPRVSMIRIDKASHGVTAEITNPYWTAINLYNATGYAVVFDRNGRVVGGANTPLADPVAGKTTLKPGAHLRVGFSVSVTRATHAEVSIDPG